MSHISFVLKITALTFVLVMLMQIKIGENTIENHTYAFLKTTPLLEPLQTVSQGGFMLLRDGYRGSVKLFDSLVANRFRTETAPGKRGHIEVKRSHKYEQELEEKQQALEDSESATEN